MHPDEPDRSKSVIHTRYNCFCGNCKAGLDIGDLPQRCASDECATEWEQVLSYAPHMAMDQVRGRLAVVNALRLRSRRTDNPESPRRKIATTTITFKPDFDGL